MSPFVVYGLRHTCLTRRAEHMAPYILAYLAVHSDFAMPKGYFHPEHETGHKAMERDLLVPNRVTTKKQKIERLCYMLRHVPLEHALS